MLQPEKEQKKHCDEITGQEKDRKCQRIPKASYLQATSRWTWLSILHPAPQQQPWHWDGEGELSPPAARLPQGVQPVPHHCPPVLLVLWPGASAEHPSGAHVEGDRAPRAESTDPGTTLDAGRGAGVQACFFRPGLVVASSVAGPCMHFWKCFETVSPEGCCCLGAAQATTSSSSHASGALTPQLPPHTQGCAAAAG